MNFSRGSRRNTPILTRIFEQFGLNIRLKLPVPKCCISQHFPFQYFAMCSSSAVVITFQFQHISMYSGQESPLSPRLIWIKVKTPSWPVYLGAIKSLGVCFQHSPPFLSEILNFRRQMRYISPTICSFPPPGVEDSAIEDASLARGRRRHHRCFRGWNNCKLTQPYNLLGAQNIRLRTSYPTTINHRNHVSSTGSYSGQPGCGRPSLLRVVLFFKMAFPAVYLNESISRHTWSPANLLVYG